MSAKFESQLTLNSAQFCGRLIARTAVRGAYKDFGRKGCRPKRSVLSMTFRVLTSKKQELSAQRSAQQELEWYTGYWSEAGWVAVLAYRR
jgi:hypothetical protein